MKNAMLAALSAYVMWGLLPAYWIVLQSVPATQILSHRIVWALVVCAIILLVTRRKIDVRRSFARPADLASLVASALLLGANWMVFIWAVNNGHVVESSLGYFINPLLSVLMGTVFLHERLRSWQWASIGLALVGVVYMTISAGTLPWIALSLATTFGLYGLISKIGAAGELEGLTIEMSLLFLPALALLVISAGRGTGAFITGGTTTTLLLAGAGIVTAFPLLLFTFGARRVPLTMLGLLQYVTPTLHFILGVFVYREAFQPERLVGFSIIWLALILYSVEGFVVHRRRTVAAFAG